MVSTYSGHAANVLAGGRTLTITQFIVPAEPVDEPARMAAIVAYGLDRPRLPPDTQLAAIVAAVGASFGVPIVLISIITDTHQCFHGCIGLGVVSTRRSISFCGHAINFARPFVVCDTLEDERFAGNPLVIGPPHIRFYAGVPLVTPNGHALGTLCIIDTVPRAFSSDNEASLQGFAAEVMMRLEELRP